MVRLYECKAKELFASKGIAVPKGSVAKTSLEAKSIAEKIGKPVAVKAQVLTGGRGKAGGVRFAANPDEAFTVAEQVLRSKIRGFPVESVLVEEKLEAEKECYVGVVADSSVRKPIVIVSSVGGISIEEAAARHPDKVVKEHVSILRGVPDYHARDLARKAGMKGRELLDVATVVSRLWDAYRSYDCRLAEINPLIITKDKKLFAADARVSLDDDALYRHKDLGVMASKEADRPPTRYELVAAKIDEGDYRGSAHFTQIDLEGTIAMDNVGTGNALTCLDELVERGLHPVNFCDTSGNPPASKLYRATKIIMSQPNLEGYYVCTCISSQRLDHTARGIVKALKEIDVKIPMFFRIAGDHEKEAHHILEEHGITKRAYVEVHGREVDEVFCAERFRDLVDRWRKQNKSAAQS